jgi:hypothetical protein
MRAIEVKHVRRSNDARRHAATSRKNEDSKVPRPLADKVRGY